MEMDSSPRATCSTSWLASLRPATESDLALVKMGKRGPKPPLFYVLELWSKHGNSSMHSIRTPFS